MRSRPSAFAALTITLAVSLAGLACAPDAPDAPTFTEDVRPILSASCARCHGATPSGGAPAGFRLDRYGFRAGRRGAGDVAPFLAERVAEGDMPRFGPSLSGRQVDTLVRWAEQAAAAGGVAALGPQNGAPTLALSEPLPTGDVTGALPLRLRFDDPDGDAAWARLVAHPTLGEPIVVVEDLELGAPAVSLDTAAWPVGEARLEAELGDDGGNEVTVDLGAITVAHAGDRAPRLAWRRPGQTTLFHASHTLRIALDPAEDGDGIDFVLAVSDDGLADGRVVTLTAVQGPTVITLPPAVDGVVAWPLGNVPPGPSWTLIATVDDGAHARRVTSPAFVIVDGTTTETYATIAADVFVPMCGHCHIVDDELAVLVPVDLRADMIGTLTGKLYRKVVQQEEMPPVSARTLFGVTMDAATRARVRSWLEGGAP